MHMPWTRWLPPVFILGVAAGYGLSVWNQQGSSESPSTVQDIEGSALEHPLRPVFDSEEVTVETTVKRPVSVTPPPAFPEQSTRMRALAHAGQWQELVRLAEELLPAAEETDKEEIRTYLELAYEALIHDALDVGELQKAGQLLSAASARLGESARRLILHAGLKNKRQDLQGALKDLHRALAMEPLLTEEIYPQIRQYSIRLVEAAEGPLSPEEKIRLLSQEIIADPGYPLYYASLGRLYYQQARYEEAITQLSYALQLEPALAPQLSSLLDAARQRRDTPGMVEIPLMSDGNTHYVDVELEGSGRNHRFVLDTGASMVAITAKVAQELGIRQSADQPQIEVITAKGSIRVPMVNLKSVQVGDARLENVRAVILDGLEGVDGLLGLSFLNRFNVDINHNDNKLLLSRR